MPLGILALRLHRAFESECFARLAAAGFPDLRMRHTMLLESIREEGARVTSLASRLGMTKQAMTELVDDLERSGFVDRIDDPADRRALLIVLSDKGRLVFIKAFVLIAAMERESAAGVGPESSAAPRATMARLVHVLADRA